MRPRPATAAMAAAGAQLGKSAFFFLFLDLRRTELVLVRLGLLRRRRLLRRRLLRRLLLELACFAGRPPSSPSIPSFAVSFLPRLLAAFAAASSACFLAAASARAFSFAATASALALAASASAFSLAAASKAFSPRRLRAADDVRASSHLAAAAAAAAASLASLPPQPSPSPPPRRAASASAFAFPPPLRDLYLCPVSVDASGAAAVLAPAAAAPIVFTAFDA